MLALALPLDRGLTLEEATTVDPRIAREYARLSDRTALRDLEALEQLELVVRVDGLYRANTAALRMQMPSRRIEDHVLARV